MRIDGATCVFRYPEVTTKPKASRFTALLLTLLLERRPPSVPMFFTGMTFKQTTGVRIFGTAIVVTTSRMGFATGFFPTGEPVHLHG